MKSARNRLWRKKQRIKQKEKLLRAGLDEDQARKYADCRHNCRQKEDAKWEADIMWREEYRGHPYE